MCHSVECPFKFRSRINSLSHSLVIYYPKTSHTRWGHEMRPNQQPQQQLFIPIGKQLRLIQIRINQACVWVNIWSTPSNVCDEKSRFPARVNHTPHKPRDKARLSPIELCSTAIIPSIQSLIEEFDTHERGIRPKLDSSSGIPSDLRRVMCLIEEESKGIVRERIPKSAVGRIVSQCILHNYKVKPNANMPQHLSFFFAFLLPER